MGLTEMDLQGLGDVFSELYRHLEDGLLSALERLLEEFVDPFMDLLEGIVEIAKNIVAQAATKEARMYTATTHVSAAPIAAGPARHAMRQHTAATGM